MSPDGWSGPKPNPEHQIPLLEYPSGGQPKRHGLGNRPPSVIQRKPLPSDARPYSGDFRSFDFDFTPEDTSYRPHEINQASPGWSGQTKKDNIAVNETLISRDGASPSTSGTGWLPYTLRKPYLAILIVLTLALLFATIFIVSYSSEHHGLGNDNGSTALLFGWRFTPTLVAVIYVQLTAMLFDDVKRTEPFARLARAGGAEASASILQAPGAWWSALSDGFSRRKNGGKRSWLLICCALVNIIGFLIISPLSSSLLTSQDVTLQTDTPFTRMEPKQNAVLPLSTERDTYFRTMGNLLQNVSTSAWITDDYTILPFWPSDLATAPLGPILSTTTTTWEAETVVMNADLECDTMTLKNTGSLNDTFFYKDTAGNPFNMSLQTVSIELGSDTGCSYGLEWEYEAPMVASGGASWSNLTTFVTVPWSNNAGNLGNALVIDASDSFVRMNHTQACGNREMIVMTTPWIKGASYVNKDFNFRSDFKTLGLVCSTKYYMANMTVTASLSDSSSTVTFDQQAYEKKRTPIPNSVFDSDQLQQLALTQNWTSYMNLVEASSPPAVGGLSVILAALNNFNLATMATNPNTTLSQAKRIRQRFFGEVLQHSLNQQNASQTDSLSGKVTVVETRVVVTLAVAAALAALLFISLCLMVPIWFLSTLHHRPLNLRDDPATTVGVASLVTFDPSTRMALRMYDQASKREMEENLRGKYYYTAPNAIHQLDPVAPEGYNKPNSALHSDWRPNILHLRMLLALLVSLAVLIAGIVILYTFAEKSRLYQTAFVYEASIGILNTRLPTVAPFSIIPTFVAVAISMWWGAIDVSFRRLQPFLSMSKEPTPVSRGAGLSYQSSYWVWAAFKAASNRHWLLCLVTIGTSLSQVFTISMSALFQRQSENALRTVELTRGLELRQVPILVETVTFASPDWGNQGAAAVLQNSFQSLSTNWMYTAAIQLALNGSQPSWSLDGWSFIPLNLSGVTNASQIQNVGKVSNQLGTTSATNVTVQTPAIRGRIECSPYDTLHTNLSSWLTKWDLTNGTIWNVTSNPKDLKVGYELGFNGDRSYIYLSNHSSTYSYVNATSILSDPNRQTCCGNQTAGEGGGSAVGYWSPNNAPVFPFQGIEWPINFTVKWIYGGVRSNYYKNTTRSSDSDAHLIFEKIPSIQALNCQPIIESANAEVTVDQATGLVQSFTILEDPIPAPPAWSDSFVTHNKSSDYVKANDSEIYTNVTTSYGIMFVDSILGAADIQYLGGPEISGYDDEHMEDQTFNYRDEKQGLNLDFMTYSMYAMANKDPQALLNMSTLQSLAQKTFSTFFQHYVSSNVSLVTGSWAYQEINASLPETLGPALNTSYGNLSTYQDVIHPISNTNRTAVVQVSTRIELLQMNHTAVWLSVAVLIWLVATTLVLAALQRRYLSSLIRNVECVGDVLMLIAGSENLLQVVRETGPDGLKRDSSELMTKLGWFEGPNGEVRWGIEVVDPSGHGTTQAGEKVKWLSETKGRTASLRSEEMFDDSAPRASEHVGLTEHEDS